MNKLVRWYNQNREIFWLAVIVMVFIIIMIQVLNSIAKEGNEKKRNEIENRNSSTDASTTISETEKSVISGEKISKEIAKQNTDIIKEFVGYCNSGETEKAYNMLTNECKTLIYPTLDSFKTNYYDRIFYMNRMYNLENWYTDDGFFTYYITYTEDILATGNVNSDDNKGDYITIVKSDEGYNINVSSYVGRKIKNKNTIEKDIELSINWIDMYIDYSILNISMKNNTKNPICIDSKENADTMYLYDSNGIKYSAFLNEIAIEQLIVYRNMTRTVNVKFNKMYNPERELSGINFSDIVLNYEEYKNKMSQKEAITIKSKI